MINTYYSSYSPPKSNLPFSSKKIKVDTILRDFAQKIDLQSTPQIDLPKDMFEDVPNYKYIQEVKIQLVKAERGVLPGNHRALNLVVNSKKGAEESSDRIWLKTGSINDLKDYLRQNPTEVHIKTKVSNMLKEAFENPHSSY